MKIGLTYDLKSVYLAAGYSDEAVAEFDSEDTIQALADALTRLGHLPVRIGNLFALAKQLTSGQTWDMVFNIAEGLFGRSREAQIPALLEAYQIPYTFSDPLTLSVALDKGMCKQIIRAAGLQTPDFLVVEDTNTLENSLIQSGLSFPLFAKPIAEGTGKGISSGSKIKNLAELKQRCEEVLNRYKQPVLVESYLAGREYTVGILGTGSEAKVIGVLEIHFQKTAESDIYTYTNKKEYTQRVHYSLVEDKLIAEPASALALASYRALGCRDAGRVDIRATEQGVLSFLEINPLAGLHPEDSDLPILCKKCGVSYDELVASIVLSAMKRLKAKTVPSNLNHSSAAC